MVPIRLMRFAMTLKGSSVFRNEVALAISILLIATCLRAPFTSLGPLLETIQASLHLSTAAAGLVNALPLLAFGTISPLAPILARMLGLERAMGLALVLTGCGIVLRSCGTILSLFAGTTMLGCGIAVCNVLLPGLVKRDFPNSIPRLTALYALTMGISGALGSVLVVPLSRFPGWDWEWASGTLFLLPFVATISWIPQLANRNETLERVQARPTGKVSLWGSFLAWQVSLFFGLTSLTYYVCVSWLPALLTNAGFTEAQAGNVHGLMQLASAVPGLFLIPVLKWMKDQRLVAVLVSGIALTGTAGLALFPQWAAIWGICIGLGTGATLVLGLVFIGLRTNSIAQAASLSGMAQGFGYLLACTGPVSAGAIHDLTGSWSAVFYVCTGLCVFLALAGWGAGRNIRIGQTRSNPVSRTGTVASAGNHQSDPVD